MGSPLRRQFDSATPGGFPCSFARRRDRRLGYFGIVQPHHQLDRVIGVGESMSYEICGGSSPRSRRSLLALRVEAARQVACASLTAMPNRNFVID